MDTAKADILLWEAFRKGDKEVFAALFRGHYEALYRYGSRLLPDAVALEDCIQDLFLELWQARSTAPVLSVKAYLLKSLKYKILRQFRQKRKQLRLPEGNGFAFEFSHEAAIVAGEISEEKRKRVAAAMQQLTSRQREIVYLKYYQNLSYEEVSGIMNINYQVARNLLYQAIRSLKTFLSGTVRVLLLLL